MTSTTTDSFTYVGPPTLRSPPALLWIASNLSVIGATLFAVTNDPVASTAAFGSVSLAVVITLAWVWLGRSRGSRTHDRSTRAAPDDINGASVGGDVARWTLVAFASGFLTLVIAHSANVLVSAHSPLYAMIVVIGGAIPAVLGGLASRYRWGLRELGPPTGFAAALAWRWHPRGQPSVSAASTAAVASRASGLVVTSGTAVGVALSFIVLQLGLWVLGDPSALEGTWSLTAIHVAKPGRYWDQPFISDRRWIIRSVGGCTAVCSYTVASDVGPQFQLRYARGEWIGSRALTGLCTTSTATPVDIEEIVHLRPGRNSWSRPSRGSLTIVVDGTAGPVAQRRGCLAHASQTVTATVLRVG